MDEWVNEWMHEWMSGWMNGSLNGGVVGCINGWKNEWMQLPLGGARQISPVGNISKSRMRFIMKCAKYGWMGLLQRLILLRCIIAKIEKSTRFAKPCLSTTRFWERSILKNTSFFGPPPRPAVLKTRFFRMSQKSLASLFVWGVGPPAFQSVNVQRRRQLAFHVYFHESVFSGEPLSLVSLSSEVNCSNFCIMVWETYTLSFDT